MRLTSDEWRDINRLEAEIGRMFDQAEWLTAESGAYAIPACCFPLRPGYDQMIELRRQIRQRRQKATGARDFGRPENNNVNNSIERRN